MKKRSAVKWLTLLPAVLLLAGACLAQEDAAAPRPVLTQSEMAPELFLVVGAPNLNAMLEHANEYGLAIGAPLGMSLQAMVGQQLTAIFKPEAIDLNNGMALVWVNNPSPVLLLPVAQADFLNIDPAAAPQQEDGLLIVEGEGVFAAAGGFALMTDNADGAKAVRALIEAGKIKKENFFVPGADVFMDLRPADWLKSARDANTPTFIDEMRKGMSTGNDPAAMAAAKQMVDAFEAALMETQELRLALDLDRQGLELRSLLKFSEEGKIAGFLSAVSAAPFTHLKYLPADAPFAIVIKSGDLKPLIDWFTPMVKASLSAQYGDPAIVEAVMQKSLSMVEMIGGEFGVAVSVTEAGELSWIESMAVKDATAARKQYEDFVAMYKDLAARQQKGIRMELKSGPEVAAIGGRQVNKTVYSVSIGDLPAGADTKPTEMALAVIKKMVGDPIEEYWTFVGNDMLNAGGAGAAKELEMVLANTDAGKALSAMPKDVPADVFMFGRASLPISFKTVFAVMGDVTPEMKMFAPAFAGLKPGSGVTFWHGPGKGKGTVVGSLKVPADEVSGIVNSFKTAMMTAMGGMNQGGEDNPRVAPMPEPEPQPPQPPMPPPKPQ